MRARRLHATVVTGLACALALAGVVLTSGGDDRPARAEAAGPQRLDDASVLLRTPQHEGARTPHPTTPSDVGVSATTELSTTTQASMGSAAVRDSQSATGTVTESTTAPTTTTVPSVCRNSHDPTCGPHQWNPDPGTNEPMILEISVEPKTATAGEEVIVTVKVSDPDATIRDARCRPVGLSYGDTNSESSCTHDCPAPFGPWDTPPKQQGQATFTFRHIYQSAGTYELYAWGESANGTGCPHPYASGGEGRTSIEVQPK